MQSHIHQLFANKEVIMSWTQLSCIQHARPGFWKQLSNEPHFPILVFGKNISIRGMLQMFKKAEWKMFRAWKISGHSVIFEGFSKLFLTEFLCTKPTNSILLTVSASFDSPGAPGGIQVVEWYVIYVLNLLQCVAVLWLVMEVSIETSMD